MNSNKQSSVNDLVVHFWQKTLLSTQKLQNKFLFNLWRHSILLHMKENNAEELLHELKNIT